MKLIDVSENQKLGYRRMAATYRPVGATCPRTCPLLENGCYAERGRVGMYQRQISCEIDYVMLETFIQNAGRDNRMIRHHVSGDFMDGSNTVDDEYVKQLAILHLRHGARGYGYTHAWRNIDPRWFVAPELIINASCDTIDDVREARQRGWNTTIMVPKGTRSGNYEGVPLVVCPNDLDKSITCADCRLCTKPRVATVGFISKNKSSDAALKPLLENNMNWNNESKSATAQVEA